MKLSSNKTQAPIDANNFRYTNNGGKRKNVDYWRCSVRTCPAKILTCKSTAELVGKELPLHNHPNSLLKQEARKVQKEIIQQHALIDGATTQNVLKEISVNIRGSTSPGFQSSMSSAGALKMALWREKQWINPSPTIPSSSGWMKEKVNLLQFFSPPGLQRF